MWRCRWEKLRRRLGIRDQAGGTFGTATPCRLRRSRLPRIAVKRLLALRLKLRSHSPPLRVMINDRKSGALCVTGESSPIFVAISGDQSA